MLELHTIEWSKFECSSLDGHRSFKNCQTLNVLCPLVSEYYPAPYYISIPNNKVRKGSMVWFDIFVRYFNSRSIVASLD
jgi:hypothetical protein